MRCQPRPDRVVAQKLRSSEPLSHDRHERSMIFRIENLGVRLRWVVILLVPENRHDVGDCTLRKFCGLPNCSRSRDELSARFWGQKDWGMVLGIAFGVPFVFAV